MRGFTQSLFLFLLFLQGCSSCDERLVRFCPEPRPCTVNSDGEIIIYESRRDVPVVYGECRLGLTSCDEDYNDICEGYVLPSEEVCDDLDNNCDGNIDEGLSTDEDGDGFNSIDSCQNNRDCDDSDPNLNPSAEEICDGMDNDCDGVIDDIDPVECWTGRDDAIVNDESSPCKTGVMTCKDGAWTNCLDQVLPTIEMCDLVDNNCDGIVDNDTMEEGTSCGPPDQTGQCDRGENVCVDGELFCVDATYAQNEACDGLDNDCDGLVDEDIERQCETECGYGVEYCAAGDWVGCTAPQPTVELCDGFDNDCDGQVDEGCLCVQGDSRTCQEEGMIDPQTGESLSCGMGIQYCDSFGNWGQCYWTQITPEVCNGWDDDCDGVVDMLESACGNQPQETVGVGQCRLGTSTCENGEWGPCVGEVAPEEEVCDELDNDCDGLIDEDLEAHDQVDMVFAIDISGSMCPYIDALALGIANYVSDFEDTDHRFSLVVFPWGNNDPNIDYPGALIVTNPSLVEVNALLASLVQLACSGAGSEPSWDIMYYLTDPTDPLGIGWREDSQPYIIMITDENVQSWLGYGVLSEAAIANQSNNCTVGGCEPGDAYEVFLLTQPLYFLNWDSIMLGESHRMYDIDPADGGRYTDILREIFQDVCIPAGE